MKRLVLLGEGRGDVEALPALVRKILNDKRLSATLLVDKDVLRAGNAAGLVRWNRKINQVDTTKWTRFVKIAALRNPGGIIALFDGDAKTFPAGTTNGFCPFAAAKRMAAAAANEGAGKIFSMAIVFAITEFETWLIAGAESLRGKRLDDGRMILPESVKLPSANPELVGKRWLEKNCPGYRPARDQASLTKQVDLDAIRVRDVRSFKRFEHAIEQMAEAAASGQHICTP